MWWVMILIFRVPIEQSRETCATSPHCFRRASPASTRFHTSIWFRFVIGNSAPRAGCIQIGNVAFAASSNSGWNSGGPGLPCRVGVNLNTERAELIDRSIHFLEEFGGVVHRQRRDNPRKRFGYFATNSARPSLANLARVGDLSGPPSLRARAGRLRIYSIPQNSSHHLEALIQVHDVCECSERACRCPSDRSPHPRTHRKTSWEKSD